MNIEPAYRLLLRYDIRPNQHELYYRYMLGEFVPTLQGFGIHMLFAWHVHGEYPERQVEFVCETVTTLREALLNQKFQEAEERLKTYTTSYERKIIHFRNRFQI